jgi:hypothetical protein
MKRKAFVLTAVTLFAAVLVCFAAADVNMGTWKLNEAKSKMAAGAEKNTTVVYATAGDNVKVTVDGVDGVDGNGKPTHNEWTGKFDGKDYAVTGDPGNDVRSYARVDSHTLKLTDKKGGKVTIAGLIKVSADGKTRTVTISTTDSMGMKVESTAVYDKQ